MPHEQLPGSALFSPGMLAEVTQVKRLWERAVYLAQRNMAVEQCLVMLKAPEAHLRLLGSRAGPDRGPCRDASFNAGERLQRCGFVRHGSFRQRPQTCGGWNCSEQASVDPELCQP